MTKLQSNYSSSSPPLHIHTPLIPSPSLSPNQSILLKLDNLQPSGSFKLRGHGHLIQQSSLSGIEHFFSSSGGNAGAAVAYACHQLSLSCTIVLPKTTPQFMLQRLRKIATNVIVHGDVWDEADTYARKLVEENKDQGLYVSPFDDELLWQGHATLVEELYQDLKGEQPKCIVVSVGGGGLFLGIIEGLRRVGWMDTMVVAAETEGTASFAKMMESGGQRVRLKQVSGLAKSLGALEVSEQCRQLIQQNTGNIKSVVVTDRDAVQACSWFSVRHRMLVEPACGAAIAATRILRDEGKLENGKTILVICGGEMVSSDLLNEWVELTDAIKEKL